MRHELALRREELRLTAVPTQLGFWVPWAPGPLLREWPFRYWVAMILDHLSRRIQGFMVCERKRIFRTMKNEGTRRI